MRCLLSTVVKTRQDGGREAQTSASLPTPPSPRKTSKFAFLLTDPLGKLLLALSLCLCDSIIFISSEVCMLLSGRGLADGGDDEDEDEDVSSVGRCK